MCICHVLSIDQDEYSHRLHLSDFVYIGARRQWFAVNNILWNNIWEKITIRSLIHHDGAVFFDFHRKKNIERVQNFPDITI